MTSADFLRFVIILSLGVLAFITFLVAGTIIGLMWLDSWSCGECRQYPVGIYILGLLGVLLLISVGIEASEAPEPWEKWIKANLNTVVIGGVSCVTFILVMNWQDF
ncbi:MAG: hypothetical protein ACLPPF_04100 [Rhodomicrobium sp.]